MKYGDVELGQIEAVLNKLGGIDGMHRLLAGEVKIVPVKSSQPKLLIPDGCFSAVELPERYDPKEFYQTRQGLYVWPKFMTAILPIAEPTEAGKKFGKVPRFKLGRDADGEELKTHKPKAIWQAKDFCAWLAIKLAGQPNGEEGELLNADGVNLFLVEGFNSEVFVVGVIWHSGLRKWDVHAWDLGFAWHAGFRFASRTTD